MTALDEKRLAFAKLDGASVTLTYMADDKTYVCCSNIFSMPRFTPYYIERTSGVPLPLNAFSPTGQCHF